MPRTRVTAVLGRAPSGVSIRPFLCEDEHARQLFVKPFGNLPSSLISEWLAARLAREMALPIPDVDLVEVPLELCRGAGHADLKPGPHLPPSPSGRVPQTFSHGIWGASSRELWRKRSFSMLGFGTRTESSDLWRKSECHDGEPGEPVFSYRSR